MLCGARKIRGGGCRSGKVGGQRRKQACGGCVMEQAAHRAGKTIDEVTDGVCYCRRQLPDRGVEARYRARHRCERGVDNAGDGVCKRVNGCAEVERGRCAAAGGPASYARRWRVIDRHAEARQRRRRRKCVRGTHFACRRVVEARARILRRRRCRGVGVNRGRKIGGRCFDRPGMLVMVRLGRHQRRRNDLCGKRMRRSRICRARFRLVLQAVQHGVGVVEKAEQHGGESHRLGCRDMTAAFGFVGAAGVLVGFGHGHLLVSVRGRRG